MDRGIVNRQSIPDRESKINPQSPIHNPKFPRLIVACIAVITLLAWAYLVHLSRAMSASAADADMHAAMGMSMDMPWTTTDVMLTFAMWVVMMVGMMAGSAAPVLLLFAGARAKRGEGASLDVASFGLGYLSVWTAFSAVAAAAQWGLHEAAMMTPAMAASSTTVAAAILVAGGIYQLTPFKNACLSHCRSPLGFLMTHWRGGAFGAFRMGLAHGAFCLGCCWALMGVLFAVGVMNLAWVAGLTVLVLVEKTSPGGILIGRLAGAVMIAAGLFRLAT